MKKTWVMPKVVAYSKGSGSETLLACNLDNNSLCWVLVGDIYKNKPS